MRAPEDFMTIQALVKQGVYLCDTSAGDLVVSENGARALREARKPSGLSEATGQVEKRIGPLTLRQVVSIVLPVLSPAVVIEPIEETAGATQAAIAVDSRARP